MSRFKNKQNILLAAMSFLSLYLWVWLYQSCPGIYNNIFAFALLLILSAFTFRSAFNLNIYNFNVYLEVIYLAVLYGLLVIPSTLVTNFILFLPAEIMFFSFWNFKEWFDYLFLHYIAKQKYMDFVAWGNAISVLFLVNLIFIKLTLTAKETKAGFKKIIKKTYRYFPILMLLLFAVVTVETKPLKAFFMLMIIFLNIKLSEKFLNKNKEE